MSINGRQEQVELQHRERTQGSLGEMVDEWVTDGFIAVSLYPLTGNMLAQSQVEYDDASWQALTRRRGITTDHRIIRANTMELYPTFVNEMGRFVQMFCKVAS